MDRDGRSFRKSEAPWTSMEGRSEKSEVPWIVMGGHSENSETTGKGRGV